MGCNLVLNMAEHGFRVVGYDKDSAKVQAPSEQAKGGQVSVVRDLNVFLNPCAAHMW